MYLLTCSNKSCVNLQVINGRISDSCSQPSLLTSVPIFSMHRAPYLPSILYLLAACGIFFTTLLKLHSCLSCTLLQSAAHEHPSLLFPTIIITQTLSPASFYHLSPDIQHQLYNFQSTSLSFSNTSVPSIHSSCSPVMNLRPEPDL
jgi:hypothetical protein